jgi:aspartate aminotransferase
VPTDPDRRFCLDPDRLARALTPRSRGVIINSPSNPTGAAYTRDELAALAGVIGKAGLAVISDDTYGRIVYDGFAWQNILQVAPELYDQTVVVSGVSKTYSMTGWRIGFAAGPRAAIAAMDRLQSHSTSNPTSIAQRAALACYLGDDSELPAMLAAFDERRRTMVGRLNAVPGVRCHMPEGAFYVFPDVRGMLSKKYGGERIGSDTRLADLLLDSHHVAVVPGSPFGGEGYIRLSYATDMATIKKGLARMDEFARRLE